MYPDKEPRSIGLGCARLVGLDLSPVIDLSRGTPVDADLIIMR